MAIKKYTKGANKKLSTNFNQREFDCHCGCKSTTLIDDELITCLQKIRDLAKKPITITSAYRCPVNNKAAGGVSNSKHCLGMAADIQISGLMPNDIAKLAEQAGCRGILRYTGSKNFVHIDTRPTKYWGYTTNGGATFTSISTFGAKNTTSNNAESTSTKANVFVWQKAAIADGYTFPKSGADGQWGAECEAVAKKAIVKKYSTGYKNQNLTKIVQEAVGVKVDGQFGNDTKAAVIAYQKKHGLTADGAVGLNTWKKMLNVK